MASIPGATAYPAIPPLDKIGNHRGLSVHAAAPLKGFTPEKERVILLKTLTTVASVALPIEERWSIKRCRYAPDGESVGRVCIATGTHGDEMMGQLIVYLVQQRISELGVRKAFGATRGVLIRQILNENLVLTLIGGAVGLVFSYLAACVRGCSPTIRTPALPASST